MNPKSIALVVFSLAMSAAANSDTTVEQLAWMSGHWCSENNGELIEEIWLPAHGAVMLGMARTLVDDRTSSFEYLGIVMDDDRPGLIAQPGGRPPVSFLRSDGGRNWVRFENPEHDFPQSIQYRRKGDSLHATIAGPGEGGKEFEISIEYVPCRE